jgi:glycosidase
MNVFSSLTVSPGLEMRHAFPVLLTALVVTGCRKAPEPPANTAGSSPDTAWVASSAIYEVFVQDFSPSGTIRGVTEGLDRIKALGTNVIWLMPIHPRGVENRKGRLGSPYAARDYRAIDSAYGTPEDLRVLVDSVHMKGMKIILDWVPNHTAWDNVWVKEHPDFYVRNAKGELTVPADAQGKPTDWTDVAELNYENPELRRAMIETMQYWLREYNLDGFRVDVAGFVPYDFWREAIPALRASVPRRILLLAEWGDLEMHRVGYDLSYGWDGYSRLKAVWKGDSASTFVRQALVEADSMPAGGMRLRFTTNHDETSWDKPPVTLFGGSAGARAAFVAMALLPGRPLMYNGQEVESPQVLNLFEPQPVAWDQANAADARAFYSRVVGLARDSVIVGTSLAPVQTSAPKDVIAYARGDVTVLVNVRPVEVKAVLSGANGLRDLLTPATQQGDTIALRPFEYRVLTRRPDAAY